MRAAGADRDLAGRAMGLLVVVVAVLHLAANAFNGAMLPRFLFRAFSVVHVVRFHLLLPFPDLFEFAGRAARNR